jgi:DNA-binding transcriptional LysR family regulator
MYVALALGWVTDLQSLVTDSALDPPYRTVQKMNPSMGDGRKLMSTLDHMRSFMRIAEHGSFTSAANEMNVAVATVSRNIIQLEKHLKTRLLNRTTRSVSLTPSGARYLAHCAKILQMVDYAMNEIAENNRAPQGHIKLHSTTAIGHSYIVPAITRFRAIHPAVTFDLTLANCIPNLIDDAYDLAIVVANRLPNSGLISKRIGDTYRVLCASSGYVKERGMPITPEDLQHHECLRLVALDSAEHWTLNRAGETVKIPLDNAALRTNTSQAFSQAVYSGIGIGGLPVFEAAQGLQDGRLIRVLPEYELGSVGIYALYPSRLYLDTRIKAWINHLCEQLANDAYLSPRTRLSN